MVKRYDCTNGEQYYPMTEDDDGEYVSFDDYEALQKRVAEMEAQICGLSEYNKGLKGIVEMQPPAQNKDGDAKVCRWESMTPEDDYNDCFYTGCGGEWHFPDGGIEENDCNFCPHCGGKVEVV